MAKKAAKRKDLEEWLHKETKRLEAVYCMDCPDEYACNGSGEETVVDLAKADYHRRVVMYYISRKLREYGVGDLGITLPGKWEVSSRGLQKRVEYYMDDDDDDDDEEWYEFYDKVRDDFDLSGNQIEMYGLLGAEVFTVDLTVPEISDCIDNGYAPAETDILKAVRLGTRGMPRAEKKELLKTWSCDPVDAKSFGYQKIYIIRFPHVARDMSFRWGIRYDLVTRLWKIACFPVMITNYHDVVTLSGTEYVITTASVPNEYEEYRYMDYGENVFNYTGLAALYLLAVVHYYLEERRSAWS